ncbi:hypothetical protein FRC12_022130 [Ceratobasidium sp. 428]|nr:hypothetical protein FRC12_022130 [Ceratobasidium sp. 428]
MLQRLPKPIGVDSATITPAKPDAKLGYLTFLERTLAVTLGECTKFDWSYPYLAIRDYLDTLPEGGFLLPFLLQTSFSIRSGLAHLLCPLTKQSNPPFGFNLVVVAAG